jgi:Asp-tRNA(Asn)/Glu-tRNA(Gln) amidotransferase A subunit family amidase
MPATLEPTMRSFFAASKTFKDGPDSPRAFLERCIETIEAYEPSVGALVAINLEGARAAADAATQRWRAGTTLSLIDGMPLGIKDIMETADMPTEQGSPLFAGWRGGRDAAAVAALREAGAVILGKTVTTEFAASHPSGTRNPWDPKRTPGGSSSGSAAAVASGMVPAALGTQVVGSIVRPSSFCGCFGFKPSVGGINRGGSFDELSQSCTGVLGASLAECWCVARAISSRAGGDPGHPGVQGSMELPPVVRPKRLAKLELAGWERATDEAKEQLGNALAGLADAGIEILDSGSDPKIAAVESALADAMAIAGAITAWEGRWPLNTYTRDMDRTQLSESAQNRLARAENMTQDDYGALIAERERLRAHYATLQGSFDLCVTLSATGAAPVGLGTTGDPVFAVPASVLGVPALTLPVLRAEGMPLGLQLIGFRDSDASLLAAAGAILPLVEPKNVG